MTAPRLKEADRIAILVNALLATGGADLETLLEVSGLSHGQFRSTWHVLKNKYLPEGKVACFDFVTGRYGIWDVYDPEATWGTINRCDDFITRLVTIEKGALEGMYHGGRLTKRAYRGLVMAREELVEQMERLGATLAKTAK